MCSSAGLLTGCPEGLPALRRIEISELVPPRRRRIVQERPIPFPKPMAIILKRRRRYRRIPEARMLFEVWRTPSLHIVARCVEAVVIATLRNL